MLKEGIEFKQKNGINYLYSNGKIIKYTPWLGDWFAFLYDFIMEKSLFPKKFEASIKAHNIFLNKVLTNIHNKNVLELATGSGNLSEFLPDDNTYTGIDISKGLLRIAHKKFKKKIFNNYKLYLCSAKDLPFQDNSFDLCICNLSLNFFDDAKTVINEIKRVLIKNGTFICSVPVPERNKKNNIIRGKLHTEKQLKEIFENIGFEFNSTDLINGTLFYFAAIKK